MVLSIPRARVWALALLPLGASACRDEPPEDALRLLEVAGFLHAEATLVSWLFDATTPEEGVVPAVETVTRGHDLALFLESQGFAGCSDALVAGDQAQVRFHGCPAPHGLGELNGELGLFFTRIAINSQIVIDAMIVESVGEVRIGGHTMEIRYYADAIAESLNGPGPGTAFSNRTDVRGTTAGGTTVDFTGDAEKAVDVETCLRGECYSPRTGGVTFEPETGCVQLVVYEGNVQVDGTSWTVGGEYSKCPNACPGDCGDYCQLSGGLATIQFDGTSIARTPEELELDCSN